MAAAAGEAATRHVPGALMKFNVSSWETIIVQPVFFSELHAVSAACWKLLGTLVSVWLAKLVCWFVVQQSCSPCMSTVEESCITWKGPLHLAVCQH